MGWTDYAKHLIPGYTLYKGGQALYDKVTSEPAGAVEKRNNLNETASAANSFADQGQAGYGAMTAESAQQREALRRLAQGHDSLSSEQLRQGLQQNMSAQRSMAASASPQNGPMAALMAAQNMGRMGAGMSGQAAMAGIQERNAAQQQLGQMIMQQRGQDQQVALGSRGNAVSGYGGVTPDKQFMEKIAPLLNAGVGAASLAASDRRLKEDVKDGSKDVNKAIEGLRSYSYKYKNEKLGKGKQVGIMAQDLEKAGLKHAVIDTPGGKIVHGGKLAAANTAMLAELGKRLSKLEKGKK
jgi:hypothetical protein